MLKLILLLWVMHLTFIHTVDSNIVNYITPSPTTQCPGESCLTLSTLAANSSEYFDPNTTVLFLKGSYTLDSELVVSNINGSLMLSTNGSGTAAIICSGNASLQFFHIIQLQISGLEFIRCSSKVELVDQFILENSNFYGGNNDSALYLNHTNANITGSSFVSNMAGTYQSHVLGLALLQYPSVNVSVSWLHSNIQPTSARVGGALTVTSSNVTISSSRFESNTAKVGGAIFSQEDSSINISDCTFINNSATGCSDDGCHGGALFIDSGCTVTAHNSIFINNTAGYSGGAIALFQGTFLDSAHNVINGNTAGTFGGAISAFSWSWIVIVNSCYYNNTGRYGGAIYIHSHSSITVDNSSFSKNEAGKHGGVLFAWHSCSITVANSSFEKNNAVDLGGVMLAYFNSSITVSYSFFNGSVAGQYDGGVMYVEFNSCVTVDSSTLDHNIAGRNGGSIVAHSNSSIFVSNSSFDNNTAGRDGGVMSAYSSSSITIGNTSFENNVAIDDGGVIYAQDSSSSITVGNCSFGNNIAGDNGGVMGAYSSSIITIENSSFNNNTAVDSGGVMVAYFNGNITVINSYFDMNTASRYDGGVIIAASSSSITVSNGYFGDNRAGGAGGVALAHNTSSVTVGSSFFNNNEADNGGVMTAQSNSNITVGNSSFDKNKAGNNGGVMYAYSSSSIIVDNCSFDNSEAGYNGGVMYAFSSSSITVGNSLFFSSEARFIGGVTYAYSSSNITVGNSFFNDSKAGNVGGVFYAYFSSSIAVGNSSFNNSRAGNVGGVMYAGGRSIISVDSSSIDNSEAGIDGGVFYAYSSSITVGNSSFNNNEASVDGGVMNARDGSIINVNNSSFKKSNAGYDGGVMSVWNSSSISVGNSSFKISKADNNGGAMYAGSSSSISVDSCSFDNNEAGGDGGVFYASFSSSITILGYSSFDNNEAGRDGGVICVCFSSSIAMVYSSFYNNKASDSGGVLYTFLKTIAIIKSYCTFSNNSAFEGGVIYVRFGIFKDLGNNMYISNMASNGGVIILDGGYVNIITSRYLNNTAVTFGGVLYVPNTDDHHCDIKLTGSTFYGNRATRGGVISLLASDNLTVKQSVFIHNSAISGGTIYLQTGNKLTVKYSTFSHNSASSDGGVIYSEDQNQLTIDNSILNSNTADNNGGVMCLLLKNELTVTGNCCNFSGNQGHRGGVVYASESMISIHSLTVLIANNTATGNGGALYLSNVDVIFLSKLNTIVKNVAAISGGAIFAVETQFIFSNGSCKLVGNQAAFGGAIYASESILIIEMNSWTNVSSNVALYHGGGLCLTMSKLNAKGYNLYITKNRANSKGGGINAASSSILIEGEVNLVGNKAENGGAISLERNAKLEGKSTNARVNLISNSANRHGGALYVDDESNPEMCAAISTQTVSSTTECFSKSVFVRFSENLACISGSNLFGGLLDRCTMHAESNKISETSMLGLVNFQNSSNINESQLDTISSHPVRLCFCRGGQPDCNYQPEPIQINRGMAFSLQLIAYNHISKPVRAAIDISSSAGGIVGSYINKGCTKAIMLRQFNFLGPVDAENLTLSIIGPCNLNGISTKTIEITFTCICPIGFQIFSNNDTACDCVCHHILQQYEKTECNETTESITRIENFWISYINHTWSNSSGYVIYPHCPFDYCYTPDKQISINLNLPNGSDAQCAHNRIGTLCGTCKPGLSVSLGSSNCVFCPIYWPGLLVIITMVVVISGIGLVAFLLALNLTVAIGTLNAIIFYANIVAANKSALFPSGVSPAFVFISWLNFDIGFDVCFFDGMDMYVKTWLQLAFPAYIIILVVVIIQLSYHFSAFGHLVGKKDPVATLATLILLSYTKLLQIIITAFSSATLDYPDGSKRTLWLPDATIEYFTSKHAMLFFIAFLIFLAGLVYTLLLFSWQWFLCCQSKRVKWIRNQKFSSFIEIYLIPFTPKHRYWTGLLLLIRTSVYLASAFNPSGDPRVTLLATNFIMTSLFLYIATFSVRMYKNRFINTMETLTYFNIVALSLFTWYTIDADTNQTIIINLSVSVTFIQVTIVIIYHAYKHMNQKLFATIKESVICVNIKKMVASKKQKRTDHKSVPADEDIHRFHELLTMIDRPANTNDYNVPQVQPKPVEPTQSVVELQKPQQAPASSPPLEAIEEKPELELTEQQASEQDDIDMIPVEENLSAKIYKNNQCINSCSGIEIAENTLGKYGEIEIEQSIILTENSIPKPNSNTQINNHPLADSNIKQAREEAMEIQLSSNMDLSNQEVPPFPADIAEQEGVDSQCIIVEAEVHDY